MILKLWHDEERSYQKGQTHKSKEPGVVALDTRLFALASALNRYCSLTVNGTT
jgi:hypothetical protein